jgi:hypothetical protein
MPQEWIDLIDELIKQRNAMMPAEREWDRTDWLYSAIAEKFAKTARGRGKKMKVSVNKPDDNKPRELEGDVSKLRKDHG